MSNEDDFCERDARSEASIYASGTPVTSQELFDVWKSECRRTGRIENPQTVYEAELRKHPQFDEKWLSCENLFGD